LKTKLILGAAALAMSATASFAAVELSGDGRMGIVYDGVDWAFTSRARVSFTLSGTADNGLEFGGSFRADNAGGAAGGTAGSVFIKGAFGKISMGDVDGAANAAVGQVSGVGLTGLGDLNEVRYLGNGGNFYLFNGTADDPSMLYEYGMGNATFYLSTTNTTGAVTAHAIGVKYAAGNYTVSFGYEAGDFVGFNWNQTLVGGSATFGAIAVKAIIARTDETNGTNYNTWAISADYTSGPMVLTAFMADTSDFATTIHPGAASSGETMGVGISYDLGGGLSLKAGYARNDTQGTDAADFGVAMSF
jgi:outer membrane protein OmpU